MPAYNIWPSQKKKKIIYKSEFFVLFLSIYQCMCLVALVLYFQKMCCEWRYLNNCSTEHWSSHSNSIGRDSHEDWSYDEPYYHEKNITQVPQAIIFDCDAMKRPVSLARRICFLSLTLLVFYASKVMPFCISSSTYAEQSHAEPSIW